MVDTQQVGTGYLANSKQVYIATVVFFVRRQEKSAYRYCCWSLCVFMLLRCTDRLDIFHVYQRSGRNEGWGLLATAAVVVVYVICIS